MRIRSIVRRFFAPAAVVLCLLGNADEKQDYITNWSMPPGSKAPAISALDAQGVQRSFEDLKLQHGLLMFFNRSADW